MAQVSFAMMIGCALDDDDGNPVYDDAADFIDMLACVAVGITADMEAAAVSSKH